MPSKQKKGGGPAVRFETELITTDKKPVYHYILVPKETAAPLGFKGNIRRVFVTVNDSLTFQASLMPSGQRTRYFISINKEKRWRRRRPSRGWATAAGAGICR